MGIISKIKSFFFDVRKDVDKKLEGTPAPVAVPQPKGDLIGQCALCGLAIGSEDRVRDFKGEKVHKRCAKKAQKQFLNGEM